MASELSVRGLSHLKFESFSPALSIALGRRESSLAGWRLESDFAILPTAQGLRSSAVRSWRFIRFKTRTHSLIALFATYVLGSDKTAKSDLAYAILCEHRQCAMRRTAYPNAVKNSLIEVCLEIALFFWHFVLAKSARDRLRRGESDTHTWLT